MDMHFLFNEQKMHNSKNDVILIEFVSAQINNNEFLSRIDSYFLIKMLKIMVFCNISFVFEH